MRRIVVNNEAFSGGGIVGFRCEANGGSAQLQFKKSDNSYANQPSSLYNADELFRLDMYVDQVYRWVLTGSALMFRES